MNLNRLARKLQTALCRKEIYVKINQFQSYSPKAERMVTKYVLIKTEEDKGRRKNTTLIETYRMADIVKKLADLYGGDPE